MNIVYKITFLDRKENNIYPYIYIGSKSNCNFVDGKIIDRNGNSYYGSSTWPNYYEIVKKGNLKIELLFHSENYNECLMKEKELHLKEDVVANPEYFNKTIASISNYSDPSYATYKHTLYGKIVRLPRNHPLVENGTYVGVTKGDTVKHSGNGSRFGMFNSFYGKTHSEQTKQKLREHNLGKVHSEESRRKMSKSRKGKKKTKEHKEKIGRKGMVNFVNVKTKETIRVYREEFELRDDKKDWLTQAKYNSIYNKPEEIICEYCGMSLSPGNYSRFHGKNCSKVKVREYNPFKKLLEGKGKNKTIEEVLYFFDEIVNFLKENKKPENMSSKRYSLEVLIPFTKNKFGDVEPFYAVIKRVYNSFREGKIGEETFSYFYKWKQKVDFNAIK
tara:strand:+ start:103625 stop:104788 length:1164 start_codon:yes stop_codon:yes gene_type:complete